MFGCTNLDIEINSTKKELILILLKSFGVKVIHEGCLNIELTLKFVLEKKSMGLY